MSRRVLLEIVTIPHSEQRYPTCGDWQFNSEGTLHVTVSDTGDDRHAFLVGLHEAIEAMLCREHGVPSAVVDQFDLDFGQPAGEDEPGNSSEAPYRKEHRFAENIERLVAQELGVDWFEYEKVLDRLYRRTQ